jgi:hypothetical protein
MAQSQQDILTLKRIASDFIGVIDPETGDIDTDKRAALGIYFMKAFETFLGENIFLPQKLLSEGGIADGAASFVYYLSSVPKTTDYDPEDWNWHKIPPFNARDLRLDITGRLKVQAARDLQDMRRLAQAFRSGNYEMIVSFYESLVKEIATSAAVKRNVLVMEAIRDLAITNGIEEINIEYPKDDSKITAFAARKHWLNPIMQFIANCRKYINLGKGIIGTKESDFLVILSLNKIYELSTSWLFKAPTKPIMT